METITPGGRWFPPIHARLTASCLADKKSDHCRFFYYAGINEPWGTGAVKIIGWVA
jgi:hypothetical protein